MSLLSKLAIQWNTLFEGEFDLRENEDMSSFTTLSLEVRAPLIIIKSVRSLSEILKTLSKQNIKYQIIGKGSNSICVDSKTSPYLLLDLPFDRSVLASVEKSYILPASLPLSLLTSAAMRLDIGGWEIFTGIPGTLGGSVFMNAGTNLGEIGSLITKVWFVTAGGEQKVLELTPDDFSYRKNNFMKSGDVIWQVEIKSLGVIQGQSEGIQEYLRKRKENQPLDKSTCGCIFKNYTQGTTCRAGQFIDIMGLQGLGKKGLKVSNRHANFIEHHGDAQFEEFRWLVDQLKEELLLNYGIIFEEEFQVLGNCLND